MGSRPVATVPIALGGTKKRAMRCNDRKTAATATIGCEEAYVVERTYCTPPARIHRASAPATARTIPRRTYPHPHLAGLDRYPVDALPQASGISLRLTDALRARSCRPAHLPHQQYGHTYPAPEYPPAMKSLRRGTGCRSRSAWCRPRDPDRPRPA